MAAATARKLKHTSSPDERRTKKIFDLIEMLNNISALMNWQSYGNDAVSSLVSDHIIRLLLSKLNEHQLFPLKDSDKHLLRNFILSHGLSQEEVEHLFTANERLEGFQNAFAKYQEGYLQDREAVELHPLPEVAPVLWNEFKKQHPDAKPPQFIADAYKEWLGKGLTRADLGKLDRPLYDALAYWLRKNTLPEDFGLPEGRRGRPIGTNSETETDTWVSRVHEAQAAGQPIALPSDTKAINRIARALYRPTGKA